MDPAIGKPLKGQAALVTGGAKRIGHAIAIALAEAGADVSITYRTSSAEAQQTCEALQALGVRALAIVCDVRDEASVNAAVATAHAHFGRLDILVNNAGAFSAKPLEAISVAEWDEMFAINTRAPFLFARAFQRTGPNITVLHSSHPPRDERVLQESARRIIHIGSLGGTKPWSTHAHYCASKAALHMLSQAMAKAWAPEIAVNCVAPGMIVMDADDASLAAKTPMRRDGTAKDVAAAVLFFATAPDFITGQLLTIDGGLGL